ncbi:MAG TPA: SRPBCC family protein [Mycobacteriales bacterium]|nr:SRPBCC family protein [Mycobacteriales bacterium]
MADEASSSITIDAEPAAVMAVIADFEAYPQWAGFIKKVEVLDTGSDGRALNVRFELDAGVIKDEYTLTYDWSGDESVRWHLVSGKALKAQDGSYTLTAAGAGVTKVDYALAVELGIPMLGMFKRKAEKVIMDTALKELKKRVEG